MALTKITGELIETSPTLSTSITLTSTDAGSSAGPDLILYRNSSSPADADYLGQIQFKGKHDGGGDEIYAKVTGKISDASSGTEDGLIETAIKGDGSFTIVSRQKSDKLQLLNGAGLEVNGDANFESLVGIGMTPFTGQTGYSLQIGGTSQTFISIHNNTTGNTVNDGFSLGNDANNVYLTNRENTPIIISTNDTERMRIDANGNVTKPSNCTFSATATAQTNLSTGTPATHDIGFGTENWDVGSNFDTSTGIFTAPVTGKYFLNASIRLNQVDAAIYYFRIIISTSNRTFATIVPANATFNSDPDFLNNQAVFIADMDANDTAKIQYQAQGGAAQVDISSSTFESYFQGYLLG